MESRVKTLLFQPDNLHSIPGTHAGGRREVIPKLFCDLCMGAWHTMNAPPSTARHTNNYNKSYKKK